ncbi:MAG: hypothetical protein U1F77_13370 [Kiritimatiellia bacterium]
MEKSEIEAYLAHLSDALGRRNLTGEIVLFGGAAMVLAHQARVSTKDVDAVFVPKADFYPRNLIQPKTRFAIEELCQEAPPS